MSDGTAGLLRDAERRKDVPSHHEEDHPALLLFPLLRTRSDPTDSFFVAVQSLSRLGS